MASFVRLVEILVSWPAITFWLCLVFRRDVSRLLKRMQSIRVSTIEGFFKASQKP